MNGISRLLAAGRNGRVQLTTPQCYLWQLHSYVLLQEPTALLKCPFSTPAKQQQQQKTQPNQTLVYRYVVVCFGVCGRRMVAKQTSVLLITISIMNQSSFPEASPSYGEQNTGTIPN